MRRKNYSEWEGTGRAVIKSIDTFNCLFTALKTSFLYSLEERRQTTKKRYE